MQSCEVSRASLCGGYPHRIMVIREINIELRSNSRIKDRKQSCEVFREGKSGGYPHRFVGIRKEKNRLRI